MPWPARFYYKNTEKMAVRYRKEQSTLGMSVERLVNNLPYWRYFAPDPERVEKKKTLVITDPSLTLKVEPQDAQYSYSARNNRSFPTVHSLLADGFEIYVLNGETLQPITDASQLNNLTIPLLSTDEIRQTIKDAHLVASETEFLDYFTTRQTHLLNLNDLLKYSALDRAKLLDIATDSPHFHGIEIEAMTNDKVDAIAPMVRQLAAIIAKKQLFKIKELRFVEPSAALAFGHHESAEAYLEILMDALLAAGCKLDAFEIFTFVDKDPHEFLTPERIHKYRDLLENCSKFSPDWIGNDADGDFLTGNLTSLNFVPREPDPSSLQTQYTLLKKSRPHLTSIDITADMLQAYYRSQPDEQIPDFEQLTTVTFARGLRQRTPGISAFSHMPKLENLTFHGGYIARSSGHAENLWVEMMESGVQPQTLTLNQFFELMNLEQVNLIPDAKWTHTFAKLKILDLSTHKFPAAILLKILEHAPKLKTLNMPRIILTGKQTRSSSGEQDLPQEMLDQLNQFPLFRKSRYVEELAKRKSEWAMATGVVRNKHTLGDFKKNLAPADKVKKFQRRKIFEPLFSAPETDPHIYRLSAYENVTPDGNQSALYYEIHKDLQLKPINLDPIESAEDFKNHLRSKAALEDAHSHYGVVDLELMAGKKIALPSLSGNETLSAIYLAGVKNNDIAIEYSPVTHFYYLTAINTCSVKAHFVVDVPQYVPQDEFDNATEILEKKAAYSSTRGDLEPGEYGTSASKTIEKVQAVFRGSCNLRAIAFLQWIRSNYPKTQAQFIGNDSHAYIELITTANQVLTFDLGGIPSDIIEETNKSRINLEHNTAAITAAKIPITQTPKPTLASAVQLKVRVPITQTLNAHLYNLAGFVSQTKPIIMTAQQLNQEYDQIAQHPGKNYRIISDIKTLPRISNEFHRYGKENHAQNIFFIDSPSQIRCLGRHASFAGDGFEGKVTKGLGGPLYDFLISDAKNKCIYIDYSRFTDEEMVQYNNILDQRVVDGVPLNDTTVLGFCTPDNYAEDDFTSRFEDEAIVSMSTREFNLIKIPHVGAQTIKNTAVIELYDDPEQWEAILLGNWQLEGDKLIYKPGKLLDAIDDKKGAIVLKNAPWDDPGFKAFWDRLGIDHVFSLNGRAYQLSDTVTVLRDAGYSWGEMLGKHSWQVEPDASKVPYDFVLNPNSQGYLLNDYRFANKKIYAEEGLLKKKAGQTLNIYVNRTIKPDAIAQILSEANTLGVILHFHLAPMVVVPESIAVKKSANNKPEFHSFGSETLQAGKAVVIYSTDVELTAQRIREKYTPDLSVDVSGLEANDLFIKTKGEYQEDNANVGHFVFEKDTCGIWQALFDGKTVLLKGHLSQELEDALLPLCLSPGFLYQNGVAIPYKGKLIIVNDNVDSLRDIPRSSHQVTTKEKIAALPVDTRRLVEEELGPNAKKYNFLQLKTLGKFLKANPEAAVDDHWQGLLTLPKSALDDASRENLNFDLDQSTADACTLKRHTLITDTLAYSPYVFIAGETGVGKSTFIHNEFKDNPNVAYYEGVENILPFARDKSGKRVVLFLDEADIGNENWHMFKDLFKVPPTLYINGEYITLSQNHKIIFAGNPLSYGGERILPDLFAQAGASITFGPLPPAYLYHHILKPLLLEAGLNDANSKDIATCFLNAYQKTLHATPGKITITPRDLQMMCLLFLAHRNGADDLALAHRCADWVTKNALLQPADPITDTAVNIKSTDNFIFTTGHEHAARHMQAMLKVQALKSNAQEKSQLKKTPGINLFIMEGTSGIGKTTVIREVLKQAGFGDKPLDPTKDNSDPSIKGYYLSPQGADPKVKEELLIRGAKEGRPVGIDEINTGLRMEKLVNGLLMGHGPIDADGKPVIVKPDFIIFGTQNSVDKKGRKVASLAVQKRSVKYLLQDYNAAQITATLRTKRCPIELAKHLGVVYENRYQYPGLANINLRVLITLTNDYLQAEPKAATIARLSYLHPECFEYILRDGNKFDVFAQKNPILAQEIVAHYINNPNKISNELIILLKDKGLYQINMHHMDIYAFETHILSRIPTLKNEEIYQVFMKMQEFKEGLLAKSRSAPLVHRTQWFHGNTRWDEVIGDLKKQMIVNIQTLGDATIDIEKLKPVLTAHTSATGRVCNYLFGYRTASGKILDNATLEGKSIPSSFPKPTPK